MKTNKQNNKNLGKKDPLMKSFPGGLVIVNPPRHYPTPPIYMNMIRSKMRFDDLENGKMKMDGQIILRDLQKRPMDITEFVDKFVHYNRLSWAYANLIAEENACQNCRFQPIYTSSELPRYKVRVDRKFIESPDMMESAKLEIRQQMFYDTFGYEEARRREKDTFITQAKVYYIDPDFSDPTILVEFTSDDLPYEDQEYDIIIMPNAMVYHSRCRTLEWIHNQCGYGEFLFPEMRDSLITKLPSVRNYNKCEEKFLAETAFSHRRFFNENQKRAIHAIVTGLHGPCPYILFGPPGTGKTVTLVEAIRLLLLAEPKQPEKRILVCTPSNTAADNFMLELLDTGAFQVDQLLRIFSFSKKVRVQNEHLLDSGVCCICKAEDGAEKFGIPPIDELLKKRVVVCTLNTSTYLIDGGLENCFTHIIIDEAGQADELETLIPIIGLTDPHSESALRRGRGPTNGGTFKGTHVILAGDPKQLGPVQICDMLKRVAKPGSLIERLIGHEKDRNVFHFDKRVTTMLEENYRSHPALIEIPSRLYYGGKLRSSAPIGEKNTLCQWSNLPKKDFPLLWHSVEEMEESDENGFSFENKAEVDIVYQYVKALIKRAKVEPEQIGIITPYRYQVKQLRLRCAQHYPEILIDSVERFQGTERRVIIISTVRSTGIGFLDSEKRFNTAVTRPKELLIVVGSSYNMRRIKGWEELITYCEQNSALIGQTELSIVQKKKQAMPDAIPPATGANATTKRTSRLRRNGAKESKENDKVEELAREFGGMDMDEWLRKKQQPTGAQNTGLFYQADEEDEREIEREMRQWGQPPNISALDDQWGQQYSYPSSFASDNISPLSNSFHISASQVSSVGGGGLMNESTCSSSIPPPKKSKKKSRKSSTSSSKQSQPQPSLIKIKPPPPKPTTLIQIQPSSKQQPTAIIKLAEKKETNIAVYTLADAIANHKKEEKKRHGKEELDGLGGRKISAATMAENTSISPDEEEYETATSGNSPKRPIDGFAIADEIEQSNENHNDEDAELSAIQLEMDTLLALKRQMDQLTM